MLSDLSNPGADFTLPLRVSFSQQIVAPRERFASANAAAYLHLSRGK